jgi:hypothetical protein
MWVRRCMWGGGCMWVRLVALAARWCWHGHMSMRRQMRFGGGRQVLTAKAPILLRCHPGEPRSRAMPCAGQLMMRAITR